MKAKVDKMSSGQTAVYREESIRIPTAITLLLLIAITIPLVAWIFKIEKAGKLATDVSKYDQLAQRVDDDVKVVAAYLSNDEAEQQALLAAYRTGSVTLIVPDVKIVESRDPALTKDETLNFEMDGIYWSPSNPLVTIEGETYRVGDTVHGHEIVGIGERSVTFKSRDGALVQKDIYDDLLQDN